MAVFGPQSFIWGLEFVTATKLPCCYKDGGISGSGHIKVYVFANEWIQDFE